MMSKETEENKNAQSAQSIGEPLSPANTQFNPQLKLNELCEVTLISTELMIEIVEQGVIEPSTTGKSPDDWRFDSAMITTAKKAIRLHKDLDIDWPGIALAINLLEEIQELREINNALEQRINRLHHWR